MKYRRDKEAKEETSETNMKNNDRYPRTCLFLYFKKKLSCFICFKLIFFLFSDYFDVLISKINFKKLKKILFQCNHKLIIF
jgi:hypothetical protein